LFRVDEIQQTLLQTHQGNFGRPHSEELGQSRAKLLRRRSLSQHMLNRRVRSSCRSCCCAALFEICFAWHILGLTSRCRLHQQNYRDVLQWRHQVTEVLSRRRRRCFRSSLNPWSGQSLFRANPGCLRPLRARGCSPSSEGCRRPEQSEIHPHSRAPWASRDQARAPQHRAQ